MSDLGRLFHWKGSPLIEPIENFTTAALAVAIRRDQRPAKLALQRLRCTCQDADAHPELTSLKAVVNAGCLTAETQRTLWAGDGLDPGYLDLVLTVRDTGQRQFEIWVEAKVDAAESGDQIETYLAHARDQLPSATVITLGRTEVRPGVPFLTWSDVVVGIDETSDPHYTWLSLREFLLDEKIVRLPLPDDPALDPGTCAETIIDINRKLRRLWPHAAPWFAWMRDGQLRNTLDTCFKADGTLAATAGPLIYGVMPEGKGWAWRIVVTTARNYGGIPLDAQSMLRDAEAGRLPDDWLRHTDSLDVLERRLRPDGRTHDEIVAWFDEGFRQLRDARILDRYMNGLKMKYGQSANGGSRSPEP